MAILDEKGLSGWVKRLLDLIFFGGIAIFISLPFTLKWYYDYLKILYGSISENYFFLLGFLYVTGFLALWIVNEIRKIFKILNRKNPFMMDNVKSLKNIAIASFSISAAYIIKIILYNTFFTAILAMVFIIAGFFSIILAEVFRQAIIFKEENDLTI